ncbi:AsmA family protein [Ruegeria profundi]|uniref:AsmA family protein n=1 Tax=Ruegeria profundi TaxID=1685378 RepID=UPI000AB54013|nr:AsmA family protein [Ruegeria profundi]
MRWFNLLLTAFCGVAVIATALIWAVLQSSFFNSLRSSLIEGFLSDLLQLEVVVHGDARVDPGLTSVFTLTDVSIPSASIEGVKLAELSEMSLQSDTFELLFGAPDFSALKVSGLTVNLLTTEDGRRTSPNVIAGEAAAKTMTSAGRGEDIASTAARATEQAFRIKKFMNFIIARSEEFIDISVLIDNNQSGFIFDFELSEMVFDYRKQKERLYLTSLGTVNGVSFGVTGDYTRHGPFETSFNFGDMILTFAGHENPIDALEGYTGQIDFQAGEIADLLNVLKLDGEISGALQLSSRIAEVNGVTRIQDLVTTIDFSSGKQLQASGSIDDLERFTGVDIQLSGRFYPEGQPPPTATRLADLKLTDFRARFEGGHRALKVEDANFRTNAFEETIDEFGPIGIGQLRRSTEGELELLDITIQAGPRDAPFIRAKGELRDALEAKDFDIDGQVVAPVRFLLPDLDPALADQFGGITGAFNFNDKTGMPKLSAFRLQTNNTDLWSLDAFASSRGDPGAQHIQLDLKSGINDTRTFLRGLGLKEIDVSPVELNILSELSKSGLDGELGLNFKASDLAAFFTFGPATQGHALSGSIESKELKIADLRDVVAIAVELGKSNLLVSGKGRSANNKSAIVDGIEVQPLVLPEKERTLENLLAEEGVQPLVLPEPTLEILLAEEGTQPLVLPEPTLRDVISVDKLLRHSKLDIGIEISKLSGVQGVTSISSKLIASDGKANFGPFKLNYGGGFVNAQAQMDLIRSPNIVFVSGSTGGWDIGKILDSVGAGIDAYGIVDGKFSLSGRRSSIKEFINSMDGTVTLRMMDGRVATSLLELAGLGVLPWLFSKERRERQTQIACLSAPLKVNIGRVSFDQFVVETKRVQVVARGSLNWRNDTVNIRAEPRPLGKPLLRSAWPVNITGKLSAANIKPEIGGSFARRSDGADTMPEVRKPCVPDILQLQ